MLFPKVTTFSKMQKCVHAPKRRYRVKGQIHTAEALDSQEGEGFSAAESDRTGTQRFDHHHGDGRGGGAAGSASGCDEIPIANLAHPFFK